MNMFIEGHSHANPYGMAAQPNGVPMPGQQAMGMVAGMPQRRSVDSDGFAVFESSGFPLTPRSDGSARPHMAAQF